MLGEIYDFIGEPWFDHDFDNVEYCADLALGAPGLHSIRRKVEFVPRPTVLPPQLFHRFDDDIFWRNPGANRHNVRIVSRAGRLGFSAGLAARLSAFRRSTRWRPRRRVRSWR